MNHRFLRAALLVGLVFVSALLCGGRAAAQCAPQWLPGGGLPGTDGLVYDMTLWDPDGAGTARPLLIVGGTFGVAGNVVTGNIAAYDLQTGVWSALGSGMNDSVSALAVLPNGDLVACGYFTTAGGVAANRIARWNGSAWSSLGIGMNGYVESLVVTPNGDLVAGGGFSMAGGVTANCIARWSGSAWSPLGSGTNDGVWALAALPNGDIVAGGRFSTAGGIAANCIARWNGSAWSSLGGGLSYNFGGGATVQALTVMPNGDVVAGGFFTTAGGIAANFVARFNGSSWSPLGSGMAGSSAPVWALTVLPNGDLVAGGGFVVAGGVGASRIARWDGSAWSALGSGMGGTFPGVYALTPLPNGDLVVGGDFTIAGGAGANGVARWSGSTWSPLGGEMGGAVTAFTALPNGDLIAGGEFSVAGGVAANHIARWNGSVWSPLGSGMNGSVYTIALLPNGDLVAGGDFTTAGGVGANGIARWDGSAWSPFGSGMVNPPTLAAVYALAVLPNGEIVAGGRFSSAGGVSANCIARWNGSAWSSLGGFSGGAPYTIVSALAVLPSSDVVAGGIFSTAGGVAANHIARWNGSAWSALGSGMDSPVYALSALPNGDIMAGGQFLSAGGIAANKIARYDGATWRALDSGVNGNVHALALLTNGYVAVAGDFTTAGGVAANRIARWDGSAWSPISSGVSGNSPLVAALAWLPSGEIAVGGRFTYAGGSISAFFARCTIPWCGVGATFCVGDGTGSTCPCANGGYLGRGCRNSNPGSQGALLTAAGTPSTGSDSVTVTCTDMAGPGIFFSGTGVAATPLTFGDGLLCVEPVGIMRMGVVLPTFGSATYPGGSTPAPIGSFGAAPGATLHYQCWYRDSVAFCTSATYNLSNGVSLTWGP